MKKCTRCGLLNDDTADSCSGCGFTAFKEKPADARPHEANRLLAQVGVTVTRHGTMVTLRCRTPHEALLVRENLEAGDIIATLPNEEEMLRQYEDKGYVDVEIPAAAYDSAGELRSIVEFSAAPCEPGLPLHGKMFAMLLGAVIVPGILIFAWLLTSYRDQGEERKANQFKLWFFLGIASLLSIGVLCAVFSK